MLCSGGMGTGGPLSFCCVPLGEPVYDEADPRHHVQRIERGQIETSYGAAHVLSRFRLSYRKSKTGRARLLRDHRAVTLLALRTITELATAALDKHVPKAAKSFFQSYAKRNKAFALWPKNTLRRPFSLNDYTLQGWIKFDPALANLHVAYFVDPKATLRHLHIYDLQRVDKIMVACLAAAMDANEEGWKRRRGRRGLGRGSSRYAFMGGDSADKAGTDRPDASASDSSDSSDSFNSSAGSSSSDLDSSSSSNTSDDSSLEHNFAPEDIEQEKMRRRDASAIKYGVLTPTEISNMSTSRLRRELTDRSRQKEAVEGLPAKRKARKAELASRLKFVVSEEKRAIKESTMPFPLGKFKKALRAIKRVRLEFELAVAAEIKAHDDRKRSKLRAKTRLELFVDESNWYAQSSRYAVGKPGGQQFHRSWLVNGSGGTRSALSTMLANRSDPGARAMTATGHTIRTAMAAPAPAAPRPLGRGGTDTENTDLNDLPG